MVGCGRSLLVSRLLSQIGGLLSLRQTTLRSAHVLQVVLASHLSDHLGCNILTEYMEYDTQQG